MVITILFAPEIWGTVSDWTMIVVTFVTAILLFRTLKSQRQVQDTQNKLLQIEQFRVKESVKPILKYAGSTDKMKPGDLKKKILTIEVINATNNTALEISKVISDRNQVFIPTGFSDTRDHLTKGDQPLLFHFLVDTTDRTSNYVSFVMEYKDIAGTEYTQNVFCICDNYGIEIHPYLAEPRVSNLEPLI